MPPSYQTQRLDHLGIVAGVCQQIDLIEEIDNRVADTGRTVSVGQAVQAMVLNALGFVSRPLYLMPEFYENKPLELLIGEGINADDLNDDSLGRALDHLYEAGITEVFAGVAAHALSVAGIVVKTAHLDSTAFSLQGEYDDESDEQAIHITHGYSRDHRPDLKQAVLTMICANASNIPVWLTAVNGNEADKNIFREVTKDYIQQFAAEAEMPYLVADSAFYSEANLKQAADLRWITRVPATLTAAKDLIHSVALDQMQALDEAGYWGYEQHETYGDIEQRWLLVLYESRQERELATLQRRIDKEAEQAHKAVAKLQRKEFACETDALQAAEAIQKEWKYHQVVEIKARVEMHYQRAGRPRPDTPAKEIWKVQVEIEAQVDAIEYAQRACGRYIIATNELDETVLSPQQLLAHYKDQNPSVERGFRFLKDPLFFASRFFLKKPSRIMALMMIMGISLLIYALAEHFLREELKAQDETLPNQKGKPTATPTMRRIFQVFEGIDILLIEQGEEIQHIITNLTDLHWRILGFFSIEVRDIYAVYAW